MNKDRHIVSELLNFFTESGNVLVLPDVTAASNESMERLHKLLLTNMDNIKDGTPLLNVVNIR